MSGRNKSESTATVAALHREPTASTEAVSYRLTIDEVGTVYVGSLLAIYVIYTVVLLALIWHYAYDNGWVWFLAGQVILVGVSAYLWDRASTSAKAPSYTKLPPYRALPVLVYVSSAVHVFVLGFLTRRYEGDKAEYAWIFPAMFFLVACAIGIVGWVHMLEASHVISTTDSHAIVKKQSSPSSMGLTRTKIPTKSSSKSKPKSTTSSLSKPPRSQGDTSANGTSSVTAAFFGL